MIVRRWSDTVLALYAEDGNPFGGHLVEVVVAQGIDDESMRESGGPARIQLTGPSPSPEQAGSEQP